MEPLKGTATGQARGIERVRYTHDAMIDLMLAQPTISQNELAATFGYSVGWVSRVIGSDAFQARLAERKVEIVNPEIKRTFEERVQGLAAQSLEVIQKSLDATSNPQIALKAFELTSKAMGLGARPQNIQQNNTYVVALPEKAQSETDWAANAKAAVAALPKPADPVTLDVPAKVVSGA